MANLKFVIHPLFFVFGIYFALTGKVFSFVIFTLVAVIHEIGHSLAAENLGYKLKRIVLMPYGAIVSGEQSLFSYVDEIKIAVAGPLVNIFTAVLFAALWWFIPETYAFTDVAVFASLSIATINLLPCYPLDGGRVLLAFLSEVMPRKTALKTVKALGIALSILGIAAFIYSIFVGVNVSLLFFSLFMLFGNIFVKPENDYIRIFSGFDPVAVGKGRRVKKIAVTEQTKIKNIYKFFSAESLLEIAVYDIQGKIKITLPSDRVTKLLSNGRPYASVGEELSRLERIR